MQVVLDPNVLVSAVVTPEGVCAELLARLVEGAVVIVVSPLLLSEVERVLARPKFQRITASQRTVYGAYLGRTGVVTNDPPPGPEQLVPADPGDDYLVRLALAEPGRIIVSGDPHLLNCPGRYPIVSSKPLLERLEPSM